MLGQSPLGQYALGQGFIASGTAYTKTLTAGITPAAAITKQTSRSLAAGFAPAAVLPRLTSRAIAAALTSTGAIAKQTSRARAASLTPSGAVTGLALRTVTKTAALTMSGALPKRTSRSLAASLAPTGTLPKIPARALAAALAPAALFGIQRTRPLAAGIAPAATFVRRTGKVTLATLAPTAAQTRFKVKPLSIAASVGFAGASHGPWYHVGNLIPDASWPPVADACAPGDTDYWTAQQLYDACWNQGDTGLRPDLYPASLVEFHGNIAITDTSVVITPNSLGDQTDTVLPVGCWEVMAGGSTLTDPASGYVFAVGGWGRLRNLNLIGRLSFVGSGVGAARTGYWWENCQLTNTLGDDPGALDADFWAMDPQSGYGSWDTCRMIARNIHCFYAGNGAGPALQSNNSAGSLRFYCVEKYQQDCIKCGNGNGDFWFANGCERTHPALRQMIEDPPPSGPTSYGRLVAKQTGAQNDLAYQTLAAFLVGDENVSIEYANDGVSQPLTVSVTTRAAGVLVNSITGANAPAGPNIRVSLATDASGNSITIANDVVALINSDPVASTHMLAMRSGGDTGAGITVTPLFKKNDGTPVNMLLLEVPANANGGIPHSDTFQIGIWQQDGFVPLMLADGTITDAGERFVTDPTYPGRLGTCVHRRFTYQGNHAGIFLQLSSKNGGVPQGHGAGATWAAHRIVLDQQIILTSNKLMELSDTVSCGMIDSWRVPGGSHSVPTRPAGHITVNVRALGTDPKASPNAFGFVPDANINGPPYALAMPADAGGGATLTALKGKGLAGVLATAGALKRSTLRKVNATLTPAGLLQRAALFHRPLTATLAPSGALLRSSMKTLAATLPTTGSLGRAARKTLTAALTPTGAAVTSHASLRALSAALAPSGAIAKLTARVLPGASLAPSGGFVKTLSRSLAAGLTPSGGVLAIKIGNLAKQFAATLGLGAAQTKRAGRLINASLPLSGAHAPLPMRALSATLATTATIARGTSRAIDATLTSSGALTGAKLLAVGTNAALGLAGSFARVAQKTIAATLPTAGAAPLRLQARVFAATQPLAAALARSTAHTVNLASSLTPTGAVALRIQRAFTATLGLAAFGGRTTQTAMNAVLVVAGGMQAVWTRAGAALRSRKFWDRSEPTGPTFDAEQPTGGWDA